MRVFVAVMMAAAIGSVGIAMLRSIRRTPASVPTPEPAPAPADVRVTYRCETCGTELLLLRRGSEAAPRHCGEPMDRRDEVARD